MRLCKHGKCAIAFIKYLSKVRANLTRRCVYIISSKHNHRPIRARVVAQLFYVKCIQDCFHCDDQSCLHNFRCSSNVWSFIYSFVFFSIYGYITNSQCDQLPDGLIAQLLDPCTGMAIVMGSNPAQAWIFFRLKFHNCFRPCYTKQ